MSGFSAMAVLKCTGPRRHLLDAALHHRLEGLAKSTTSHKTGSTAGPTSSRPAYQRNDRQPDSAHSARRRYLHRRGRRHWNAPSNGRPARCFFGLNDHYRDFFHSDPGISSGTPNTPGVSIPRAMFWTVLSMFVPRSSANRALIWLSARNESSLPGLRAGSATLTPPRRWVFTARAGGRHALQRRFTP